MIEGNTSTGNYARLSISLLGSFRVTLNGKPVSNFESDKGRALLAYLAVEADKAHRREALFGLLWPDLPEDSARNNLRQSLFKLRQAIGDRDADPAFLLTESRCIQLNPDSAYWSDVSTFTELISATRIHSHERLNNCDVCMQRLRTAIDLYRGDFLAGFSLPDSDLFQEWALLQQETYHRMAMDALSSLTDYYENRRDYAQAITYAQRQIAMEPWREEAYRQSMRILVSDGQRSAALNLYKTCEEVLEAEFGAEPAVETQALFERIRSQSGRSGSVTSQRPFKGLQVFTEEDADDFLGRDAFAEDVVDALEERSLVVISGPSGSGKSSAVQAGVFPRLREQRSIQSCPMTPSRSLFHDLADHLVRQYRSNSTLVPLEAEVRSLAEALARGELTLSQVVADYAERTQRSHDGLVNSVPGSSEDKGTLLLVVDQLERLSAPSLGPELRQRFLDLILEALSGSETEVSPRIKVLLVVGSGYFDSVFAGHPLAERLTECTLKLDALGQAQLKQLLRERIEDRGIRLEVGLEHRLLHDIGEGVGKLSLLEYVLARLWERRDGDLLTHAAYDAMGCVEGALVQYAEEVFSRLSLREQQQARHVMLHLASSFAANGARRKVTRAELGEDGWAMARRLADMRLIVTDGDLSGQATAEFVHDSLPRGWERLHDWLEQERALPATQPSRPWAPAQWRGTTREAAALLIRVMSPGKVEEWLGRRIAGIGLGATHPLKARLQPARLQISAARNSSTPSTPATAVAGGALPRQRSSRFEALMVLLALLNCFLISGQLLMSRQGVFADAGNPRLSQVQPSPTGLLNEELDGADTVEQVSQSETMHLTRGLQATSVVRELKGPVSTLAFSPDGLTLASGTASGDVVLWDAVTPRPFASAQGHTGGVTTLGFHPSGQMLASGGSEGAIRIWDAKTGELHTAPALRLSGALTTLAFGEDGATLLTAGDDGTLQYWETSSLDLVDEVHPGRRGDIATLCSDGRLLVAAEDNVLTLWDTTTRQPLGPPLVGHDADISSVTLDSGCRRLASSSLDGTLILWDLSGYTDSSTPGIAPHLTLQEHGSRVKAVAFSPDGKALASGAVDSTITLWDVASGEPIGAPLTEHDCAISSLAFSPDGSRLASGSIDGSIVFWRTYESGQVAQASPAVQGEGGNSAISRVTPAALLAKLSSRAGLAISP